MDNKNLPVAQKLMKPAASGAIVIVSALGTLLTTWDFLFIALGIVGVLLFIAGNLINKSLSTTQDQFSDDPMMTSLKSLQHKVAQTKYLTKVSDLGVRAHEQTLQLEERWKFLQKVINQKFSQGELTYSRYMNAVTDTVQSMLQNFNLLSLTLNSLEMMKSSDENYEKQKTLCVNLLETNDKGLSQMAELANSLSLVNAGGSTDDTLNYQLEELKKLASQAKKYSN